jgi:hypothetical protein
MIEYLSLKLKVEICDTETSGERMSTAESEIEMCANIF